LFSQTFYSLLFSYLTMTDVTSQPEKLVKLTKSLLYHECLYLQNFTEKNNSCTPCVLMFCLQEDFVKWKGSLFYRFITTLVDEDVEIRKFGKKVWCFSFLFLLVI